MILFIKLLLAHLLGDFVLQPESWVRDKELNKQNSSKLYLHGLIHFGLIIILVQKADFLWIAAIIAISHILIDLAKLHLQHKGRHRLYFVIDQLMHLAVILVVVYFVLHPEFTLYPWLKNQILIIATGIIILLMPSSVLIKLILSKWAPATEIKSDKIETLSLQHAGMMIGYLERTLVFIFILNNQWAAIGFLVTAKSVFRFSDLKIGQDRKLTEYILIGTLLSFGIAIITGVCTVSLMGISKLFL